MYVQHNNSPASAPFYLENQLLFETFLKETNI
jgi:hypothetical protein